MVGQADPVQSIQEGLIGVHFTPFRTRKGLQAPA